MITTTSTRAQWPHTIEDIVNSLEGVWGIVGATTGNGNVIRLEKSLHEPLTYTLTEYQGSEEGEIVRKMVYEPVRRDDAITEFAKAIGFEVK